MSVMWVYLVLFEIILLLISYYYLKHGLYPLFTGKPVIKADVTRKTVIGLLVAELIFVLVIVFLAFVALYGYSYNGLTIGDWPFYGVLFLFCLIILWVFYHLENDSDTINQSIALVAVHPDYAMPAVRETLDNMQLEYQDTLSGFHIDALDVTIPVNSSGKLIRFSVIRPLDKIFLNKFCRTYQRIYAQNKFPLAQKFAWLSTGLGLGALVIAAVNMAEYWIKLHTIVNQATDLIAGLY